MTRKEAPPVPRTPQPEHADGGGVTRNRQGKPLETMGRKATGLSRVDHVPRYASRVANANHGKLWDAKLLGG